MEIKFTEIISSKKKVFESRISQLDKIKNERK